MPLTTTGRCLHPVAKAAKGAIRVVLRFNRWIAYLLARPGNFSNEEFRRVYRTTYSQLREFRQRKDKPAYAHSIWQDYERQIARLNDRLKPGFLNTGLMRRTFYRCMGFEFPRTRYRATVNTLKQARHVLDYARSPDCESDFKGILRDCREFNISSNSAELLCQINEIARRGLLRPTIVEFGGGFGAAARHFAQWYKPKRYVIIDLAETLHLAHVYLKLTVKNPVIWCGSLDGIQWEEDSLLEGAIFLIPRELIESASESLGRLVKDGLFYASYSFSESDPHTIEFISRQILPYTGAAVIFAQRAGQTFDTESEIRQNIERIFSHTESAPYFYHEDKFYALFASR